MLKRSDHFLKNILLDKKRLFIASSRRVGVVYPKTNYTIEIINKMKSSQKKGLAFGSVIYDLEENHQSMPTISFYQGLRFIFDGYMIDEETRFRSANELKKHFEAISKRLGSHFYLREDIINWFGHDRLKNDQFGIDIDRAIEFFKMNVENYPESINAWKSLREGYLVKGNEALALHALKKYQELENR